MKKTIEICTPQEQMPPPDTQLLLNGPYIGITLGRYMYGDNWSCDNGSEIKTDSIFWWMDLEKLTTDKDLKAIDNKYWNS